MTAPVQAGIEIVRATAAHVPMIHALAQSRNLEGIDPAVASQEGFLVSEYTAEVYQRRLVNAEHFYVAVKGDDVLGFLLAYSDTQIEPDEWLNRRIKTTLGSFLVIKQVCVAREAARQGVASRLYHHVLEQWTANPVIAAVVDEPPNEASSRFHRKMGFEELTRLRPPDGRMRVVWVSRKPRESLLETQYEIAVDLYKHEDLLNWNKLNNFLYITAGLAATLAFTLGKEGAQSHAVARGVGAVIAVIGFGSGLAFAVMLRFGRRYLQKRKSTVVELEEYMAWHGGQRIVGRQLADPGSEWLQASPTGLVMVLLPVFVSLGWLAMLGVVLAN
ncbi:GNAT family N-acetyltransferase [Actinacidiphila guanduensis]|uniref:Predicted acetyltransferase, GNAT superfamily n=1 Tax=Actinacidiphila guanduensis TaxID=310781 RepID=A0A1H0QR65_9ACTN|nr:GNAT family N-acetyltransferase [Actinacidiphila guanduensis]SDP19824.1 Predicted acetyltransferase, GNAT superfamily [Actinacidiphila guanduensis]